MDYLDVILDPLFMLRWAIRLFLVGSFCFTAGMFGTIFASCALGYQEDTKEEFRYGLCAGATATAAYMLLHLVGSSILPRLVFPLGISFLVGLLAMIRAIVRKKQPADHELSQG